MREGVLDAYATLAGPYAWPVREAADVRGTLLGLAATLDQPIDAVSNC